MKNKKGGISTTAVVILVAIFMIVAVGTGVFLGSGKSVKDVTTGGTSDGVDISTCPDDGDTSFTINLYNDLNETGSETFDASYIIEGDAGDYETGTDTTDGTETLNCGETYTLKLQSADGDAGDNSMIERVIRGPGAVVKDGYVVFTPTKSSYDLRVGGSQHAILEVRAYDNDQASWVYDDGDASATDYETDGVTFTSTTDNTTATAVGSGGEIDMRFEVRATRSDTDFTDYYTLILVEAPVAIWNEPTVSVDGEKLQDAKGTLKPDEEKQFSSYEYIYKYEGPITDDGVDIDYHIKALAGVDSSTDLQIDLASAGNYLSNDDGVSILRGAAQDDSSATVVFTVQDITLDIS